MPCDYKNYPDNWKTEIRPAILERDNHRCKFCGVPNHAVGYRNEAGEFIPTGGNIYHDQAGMGLDYPSLEPLSYKKAKDFASVNNLFGIEDGSFDYKYIVIVLTIMHLDHDTTNNEYENLAAACQKCHLTYDKEYHRKNAKETNDKKKGLQKLF